mgnify:CR=1 FL=1
MNLARAVIFDLDGTLVDSLPDITSALNRALAKVNRRAVDARDVRGWIGDGVRVLCERALAHTGGVDGLDPFVEALRETYAADSTTDTRCFPNVLKMLDLLHGRRVPCAVLTNKPHVIALHMIEALDLRRYFVSVRGCAIEEEKKPSPTQALAIAREMKIDPSRVMFVGDSIVDMTTARNAGMIACAVSWGYQEKSDLLATGPDFFVDDPLAIEKLLERN